MITLTDGRAMQFLQTGAHEGSAVFFLPGCPDSRLVARTGEDAAMRLGIRVVAVNRPGYGASDPHASDHLTVADDVVEVADQLGVDRFAVLGMSVGGPYALACAARHPQRVTAVAVVAAPAMQPHRDDLAPAQQELFARAARGTIAAAVELFRAEFEEFVDSMELGGDDDGLAVRWAHGLPGSDRALLTTRPAAELAASAREALACPGGYLRDAAVTFRPWAFDPSEVTCPTWLWYGGLDDNAPPRNGHWLADRIPQAALTVLPDTTHLGTLIAHWDEVLRPLAG